MREPVMNSDYLFHMLYSKGRLFLFLQIGDAGAVCPAQGCSGEIQTVTVLKAETSCLQ